jgi:general secretion pathway protein A
LSDSHKEALALILYGVEKRKGFIAVTGEVGTGKTTVIRSYLQHRRNDVATDDEISRACSEMPPERASSSTTEAARQSQSRRPRLVPIYLFNSAIEFDELVRTILKGLHIDAGNMKVAEMVERLHWALIAAYREGHIVALFIDEAQNMPVATLENLRMLSNLETHKQKLLQIVLVGQPELEDKLSLHSLRQLKQRIAVRVRIERLTRKESQEYIGHRLAKAALLPGRILDEKALQYIVLKAQGCPRTLNIICDNALIAGYGSRERPISFRLARRVVADLELKRPSRLKIWWAMASGLTLAIVLTVGTALAFASRPPAENATVGVHALVGKASMPHIATVAGAGDIDRDTRAVAHAPGGSPGTGIPLETARVPEKAQTEHAEPADRMDHNEGGSSSIPDSLDEQAIELLSGNYGAEPSVVSRRASPLEEKTESGQACTPLKSWRVRTGDTLTGIARQAYGSVTEDTLSLIRKCNPQIIESDIIRVDDELKLPTIQQEPLGDAKRSRDD